MRELLVRPLGLVTRPNQYGQYPVGALRTAQNLVMRAPGIIEVAPATVLGGSFASANNVVHHIEPLPSTKMLQWVFTGAAWSLRTNGTTNNYNLNINLEGAPVYSTTGRISAARTRDRTIFNSENFGNLALDGSDPAIPATIRRAGLCQAIFPNINFQTANAITIPANSAVAYIVLKRRIFSDGYELVSMPSVPYVFQNSNSFAVRPQISIPINDTARDDQPGDVYEVYRTNIIAATTSSADPGTTAQLIHSHAITSAEISVNNYSFFDDTIPGPLGVTGGKALYTNPGQGGSVQANIIPEAARCIAVFKTFTFYGNITERPQLKFSVPGGMANTAPTASPGYDTVAFRTYGVGTREVTGTVTNGSAVITGVSATHLLGIVPNQAYGYGIGGAVFPGLTVVQSVNTGAGTITMSAAATSNGSGIAIVDVLTLAGLGSFLVFGGPLGFMAQLTFAGVQVVTSESILRVPADPANGTPAIDWNLSPLYSNPGKAFTWTATNGQNYSPAITEIGGSASSIPYKNLPNELRWSKDNQPEHVPPPNSTQVGSGSIIAMESTRDALWIFCTDGLYRLSGAGGQWRVDTVDTTCILSSPRASCVLREVVYAYTNAGFVRITDAGVDPLSERIVGDLLPGAEYTETASIIVERNETEEEVVIRLSSSEVYVYNTRENAYTTLAIADVTCMAYARYPVSGAAALAFGRSPSGSTPRYELWNATNSFLAASALFQPMFAQDPFSAKQWINATFVFNALASGKSLFPVWNDVVAPLVFPKGGARFYNESRLTVGIPRVAAIGNTIAPGFVTSVDTIAVKLNALSLRYRQFGEQSLKK